MEKVICDICGTSYPESEDFCPICGCSQDVRADMDMELEDEDFLLDSPIVTARLRKEAELNPDLDEDEEEEEEEDEDDGEDEEEEEPRRRGVGLVIFLVILIMLLLAAAGFLFLRYVLPNMGPEPTKPTESLLQTEAPVETTTEPGIPCQQLVLTSGGVVELTREGEYKLINVIVKPEDTTDKLMYSSSDEAVASVTEEGRITGLAEGEATITISCGAQSIECRVVVTFVAETEPPTEETEAPAEETEAEETEAQQADGETKPTEPEETTEATEQTQPQEETAPETQTQLKDVTLKLAKNDFSMGVGYQYTIPLDCDLTHAEIEWSTGNEGIAIIRDGVITTISKGTTQMFAKYGDQTVSGWIRVK